MKRLYRSTKNKVIAGVCGGIGEYFGMDPVIVRLVWVLFSLVSFGFGFLAYLISWMIIPKNPGRK
jgi:phage shock protein PspC (stress-responsive transcriptional regulator)